MFLHIIIGLLMGIVFGIALEKGRVFEPGMIVGQFQLRNFLMLRMFMSAIATSLVVIGFMHALGWVELYPKAVLYPAIIVGALLFGVGMALAGACPGTVLAQIGAGYRDAWVIVAGGLCGAMTYGYMEPILAPLSTGPGKVTLSDKAGLPFTPMAIAAAIIIIVILLVLERWRSWRTELGNNYDGLLTEPESQDSP